VLSFRSIGAIIAVLLMISAATVLIVYDPGDPEVI
jgi:hypothetical protein